MHTAPVHTAPVHHTPPAHSTPVRHTAPVCTAPAHTAAGHVGDVGLDGVYLLLQVDVRALRLELWPGIYDKVRETTWTLSNKLY